MIHGTLDWDGGHGERSFVDNWMRAHLLISDGRHLKLSYDGEYLHTTVLHERSTLQQEAVKNGMLTFNHKIETMTEMATREEEFSLMNGTFAISEKFGIVWEIGLDFHFEMNLGSLDTMNENVIIPFARKAQAP